jgi:hypothetical protein
MSGTPVYPEELKKREELKFQIIVFFPWVPCRCLGK